MKKYIMNPIDRKPFIVKLVRDDIKEININKNKGNKRADVLEIIIERFKTEPRWIKAVHHLAHQGKLVGAMQDMGVLVQEVQNDVFEECGDDIKEILFEFFRQKIAAGLVKGMPEFYKEIIEVNI